MNRRYWVAICVLVSVAASCASSSTQTMPVSPSPCVAYQGCDAGYPVIWCEFSGGHMPWSQAPDPVWAFFNQF